MNRIIKIYISFITLSVIFISSVHAAAYALSDVAKHNSSSDCWVIYDNQVYDITNYLSTHDTRYYPIDSWCGTDITSAYDTKDGQGQGHKPSTTSNILSQYYIGDVGSIAVATVTPTETISVSSNTTTPTPTITISPTNNVVTINKTLTAKNPYDFWPAFLITTILLWGSYALSKSSMWKSRLSPLTYNMIWNSMLILSLIPSAMFGLFMILQYSVPSLASINFNFLYWHVEGSICFAVIVLAHIILRLKTYFAQVRATFRKRVSTI